MSKNSSTTVTSNKVTVLKGSATERINQICPKNATLLQKKVFKEALSKSSLNPHCKSRAFGAQGSSIPVPSVCTKRGPEKVVQQIILDKTVQRSPKGEYVGSTITGIDVDTEGRAKRLEMTSQQLDPSHATESAGINELISATSSISVTSSGTTQTRKTIKKKTTKDEKTMKDLNLNPYNINRLVREEIEDVENTLRMVPPDLISTSIDKIPLKKKVHNLRLNSESMALLEQSVIYPTPTADEVDVESPPEVLATIIAAVEKGATPKSAPAQIFNTLFPEVKPEERIDLNPIVAGPLEDIVVPTSLPPKINEEILTDEINDTVIEQIQNCQVLLSDDIVFSNNISPGEHSSKGKNHTPVTVGDEIPPWEEEDILNLSLIVGGDLISSVESPDASALENSQDLSQELAGGIDYFLDAVALPYETKIQIRGSRLPGWFPGYMSTFPHLPELIKISKSPSTILLSAWKAVQPKIFTEDQILIV